jgi:tRNA modification GTPase
MDFVHRPYIPGETIAAIATPPGEGGIAIVRISGEDSLSIAAKLFSGPVSSYPSHTAHVGKVLDAEGQVIDEVLFLSMHNPRSFTGDDVVELHCHGGSLVTKKVLERALSLGARAALPGEFSFKAFMNGKIDLAKAEAIQDVISAKNEHAYQAAENQLQGALSKKIQGFQRVLLDTAAILDAWVDYPEEGLEFASKEELLFSLEEALSSMKELSHSFSDGKVIHEGLSLCLAGPPNAGKSSLMNALLGKDRAIVTNIAGTTRDLLEDNLYLSGLHFRLIDTAGIRDTEEVIEKEGIKRSKKSMEESDIVLLVLDASIPLCKEGKDLLDFAPKDKTLVIWNKSDLPTQGERKTRYPCLSISALTGNGLNQLKETISKLIWKNGPPAKDEVILTNLRHKQALDNAISFLSAVIIGLDQDTSPEFLSFDMRKCLFELGTILGLNISEEILNAVFSKFCVGK